MSAPTATPPTDDVTAETRAFWREIGQGIIKESIGTLDETAKQLIGVAGILEGLYFHGIAFGDLRGKVADERVLMIYLAPIALLLLSLISALWVLFPDAHRLNFNSSEASKLVYERVVRSKLWALRVAGLFLVLGVLGVLAAAAQYLR